MKAHFEVRVGGTMRRARLEIDRDTGTAELRFYGSSGYRFAGERYLGHVNELAEALFGIRSRELAREAAKSKAIRRRGGVG